MKKYNKATWLIFVSLFLLISIACSLMSPPTTEKAPTATPPPYPADWQLLLADDFNDNSNEWASLVPDTEAGSISSKAENGVLDVTLKSKEQAGRNTVFQSKVTHLMDFYISFEAEQKELGNDAYFGLEFRTIDLQGYVFMIDQRHSQYSLAYTDTGWHPIIDFTTSTAINSNTSNKIGLLINGSSITMFINDLEIAKISDSRAVNPGTFGFTVGLFSPNGMANITFDNLQIYGPSTLGKVPTLMVPRITYTPATYVPPVTPIIATREQITMTPAANEQTGRIEGRVYRADASQPVFNATLILMKTGEGTGTFPANMFAETTTDIQGRYSFAQVVPGPYLLFLSLKNLPEYQNYPFCTDTLPEGWEAILTGDATTPIALVPPNMEFSIAAGDVIQKDIDMKDVKCE